MSRATHDRATHRETFSALLVEVGEGTQESVEEYVRALWNRLVDQESQTAHRFTVSAVVKRPRSLTFSVNAYIA